MSHGCKSFICIDKPNISSLSMPWLLGGFFRQTAEEKLYPQRPLYRSEFGRISWKILHRLGSLYPETPAEEEKTLAKEMYEGLAMFFPCEECAADFKKNIEYLTPTVDNRVSHCEWLCYQHNQVNKKIGKTLLNCEKIEQMIEEYKL